jgi:hypothetical protein
METLPEDDIYKSNTCSEGEPEPLGTGDAVTLVLVAHGRGRVPAWLRAPRVAAVTLVVCGAGVSVRLLRRPGGHDGHRAMLGARQLAPGQAERRDPAVISADRRARASSRRGAGRQRGGVHGHAGPRRRARVVMGPPRTDGHVQSRSASFPHVEGGVARDSGAPTVEPAPVSSRGGIPSPAPRRRPPCVPGTLGC